MAQQPEMKGPNIDLTNTTAITSSTGGKVFSEGVIPVFYDPETGEIMTETLPKELREEYK